MKSDLTDLIHVRSFDPNEFLVIYRKLNNGEPEDRVYMPLRAAHEWFLLKHPDGTVQATYDLVTPDHVIAHAIVRYDGRDVTDAYADGYHDDKNPNFVANAIRAAKRAALANAGFGVPHDAVTDENTPIIQIADEMDMPDGSFEGAQVVAKPAEQKQPAADTGNQRESNNGDAAPAKKKRRTKKNTGKKTPDTSEAAATEKETPDKVAPTELAEKKESEDQPQAEQAAEQPQEESAEPKAEAAQEEPVEIDIDEMTDDDTDKASESKSEAPETPFVIKSGKYQGLTFEEVYERVDAEGGNPLKVILTFTTKFQDAETKAAATEFIRKLNNMGR